MREEGVPGQGIPKEEVAIQPEGTLARLSASLALLGRRRQREEDHMASQGTWCTRHMAKKSLGTRGKDERDRMRSIAKSRLTPATLGTRVERAERQAWEPQPQVQPPSVVQQRWELLPPLREGRDQTARVKKRVGRQRFL